ncbi:MAG: PE-PGRS family protein [Pseudonocardiaceae bacterium]|nr:MAG: PE-PGRS family protein [Pseudonocardiaceae bacterium]
MSDGELILREHESAVVPSSRLGERGLDALALAPADLLRVRLVRRGVEIRARSVTGVVELGGLRVRVLPKLFPDGVAVLSWLAYAAGVPVDAESSRTWEVGAGGLRDLVTAALVSECTRLVRDGLRLDYRREQAVDTVLRGRLDVRAQVTQRYGQIDRLHLDRFGRRTDVWENVVCRIALDEAARTAGSLPLRKAARTVAAAFPLAGRDVGWARRSLRRARHHRLNARYRAAHLWASVLLDGGGIEDLLVPGPWRAGSLLVRTDRIWERAVARACVECDGSRDDTVAALAPIRVLEDGAAARTFRPDASLVQAGPVRVPVDAKYKDYGSRQVTGNDVHQLLTYAMACSVPDAEPSAVLVHPVVGRETHRTIRVRSGRRRVGRVLVVGLDTRRPPTLAARSLDTLLALVSGAGAASEQQVRPRAGVS